MFGKYLKSVFTGWANVVFLLFDLIGVALYFQVLPLPDTFPRRLIGIGLIVIGFVAANYLAWRDLAQRLTVFEEKRLKIVVGFCQDTHLVHKLTLDLHPLPPKPDYDALVAQKRKSLLGRYADRVDSMDTTIEKAVQTALHSSYEKKIDGEYLPEYRRWLEEDHKYRISEDRLRCVQPMIENQGSYPADDIEFELELPAGLSLPTDDQIMWGIYTESPPERPKPPDPSDPFDIRSVDHHLVGADALLGSLDGASLPPEPLSNTEGPNYETRDGVTYIEYKVEQLIPHRSEYDFDPLPLWLGDVLEATVWEIPVKIYGAALQEPEDQTLLLEIRSWRVQILR